MGETISLIVPTYNEAENISALVERVSTVYAQHHYDGEIIVVDDNSPDGTWRRVQATGVKKNGNVVLLRRLNKRGLASAVLEGFRISKGTILGVMDADLSHPPERIPDLIEPIIGREADFTIGSRYVAGGKIEEWPWKRRMASRIASMMPRSFLKVKDPLSGFFFVRRDVIKGVHLNPLGFKIGLEIIAKGRYQNVVEIPIVFRDRKCGKSKIRPQLILDYLVQLFLLTSAFRKSRP